MIWWEMQSSAYGLPNSKIGVHEIQTCNQLYAEMTGLDFGIGQISWQLFGKLACELETTR